MQGKDVEAFKNTMRSYQYNLERLNYYESQIDDCYNKLGASPQSIDLSEVRTHSLPNKDFEYMLRDNIKHYEEKKKYHEDQIRYVDSKLSIMPVEPRNMMVEMFILGDTEIAVASRYFISPSGMRKRINKAIKKALAED